MKNITLTFPRENFLEMLKTSESFRNLVADQFAKEVEKEQNVTLTPPNPDFQYDWNVSSNTIQDLAWNILHQTLYIRFRSSGTIYRYDDVPQYLWERFQNCGCYGEFYNQKIKGQYKSTKVNGFPDHVFPF